MSDNYYKPGCWNALCDVCGFKFKSDALKQRWDGLRVCEKDWEMRHPSDLIHVPEDNPSVPWARPEPTDSFISTSYPITIEDFPYDYLLTESGLVLNTEG